MSTNQLTRRAALAGAVAAIAGTLPAAAVADEDDEPRRPNPPEAEAAYLAVGKCIESLEHLAASDVAGDERYSLGSVAAECGAWAEVLGNLHSLIECVLLLPLVGNNELASQLQPSLLRKCRTVAVHRGETVGDYLAGIVGPAVQRDCQAL